MKVSIRRQVEEVETESIRVKIHDNEYLIKEGADGLYITEVGDIDNIMIRPQVANSIVIVTKRDR